MDQFAQADRPAVPPVRLRRRPGRRARHRPHGLRRGDGRRDGRVPERQGREGRRAEGPAVPAVLGRSTSWRRCRKTVKTIAVLDRTKEPGALGEPLYLDVVTALQRGPRRRQARRSRRCRRSSAAATACRARNSRRRWSRPSSTSWPRPSPKNHFTVGIVDDVTHTVAGRTTPSSTSKPDDVVRAVFFGLGADGTVGANKNSIKIIGEETDNYAQGYFVYDSKKSGAMTISHLRFGPQPIRSPYLISRANFVACHQFELPREVRRARVRRSRARCSC